MPLYKVSVEIGFIMEAESEPNADAVALDYAEHAVRDGGCDISVSLYRLRPNATISDEWSNSLPYGSERELTVGQILEEEAQTEADARQLPLPGDKP